MSCIPEESHMSVESVDILLEHKLEPEQLNVVPPHPLNSIVCESAKKSKRNFHTRSVIRKRLNSKFHSRFSKES